MSASQYLLTQKVPKGQEWLTLKQTMLSYLSQQSLFIKALDEIRKYYYINTN